MAKQTLWNFGQLALLFAVSMCICQTVCAFQDSDGEPASTPSAACATPASSRPGKATKSVPFRRPAFHPPKINSETDRGPEIKFQPSEFESEIERSIIQETKKPNLPKLNSVQIDEQPENLAIETGPQLNVPGTMSQPASSPQLMPPKSQPEVAPEIPAAALPTPGPIAPEPIVSPEQYLDKNFGESVSLEFNFCDAGCQSMPAGSIDCSTRPGRLLPLRRRAGTRQRAEFDQQAAAALWDDCNQQCKQNSNAPALGIGADTSFMGEGIARTQPAKIDAAKNVPGLMQNSPNYPMQNVSSSDSRPPTTLPESMIAVGAPQRGQNQQNNGIIVHPPILQPFNRNQHTFIIENRSDAVAEDVVIEISVQENDRIIAALPANSVTTEKVSIFKFPKIVAGEKVPVHLTAVSRDASPIEFSASLVSRAVYSFHMQEGLQNGKLTKVSYLNEKSKIQTPSSGTDRGPVRVTNPFFGRQPWKANQAANPTPSLRRQAP